MKSKGLFVNPIILVVVIALTVAALIAASQLLFKKQEAPIAPEPERPKEAAKPEEGVSTEVGGEEGEEVEVEVEVEVSEGETGGSGEPSRAEIGAQPFKGNPDAPVTIVEFAEFYCPFCARYLWETYPKIEEEYIDEGLVRYEFRNLVVHGAVALLAAVAGECAHEQGKFWALHDRLFEAIFKEEKGYLDVMGLEELAEEAGLELAPFSECLEGYERDYNRCLADYRKCAGEQGERSEECAIAFDRCLRASPMAAKVLEDQQALYELMGKVPESERTERIGTPLFFIGNHLLIGAQPYEKFKELIDQVLEEQGQQPR